MTTSERLYPSFPAGVSDGSGNRALTKPAEGVKNSGHDNVNSDLIMRVNDVLVSEKSERRYMVMDMLGQGTFGQVVKCWSQEMQTFVAVKVIKNQEAYYHQARVEVGILHLLNKRYDTERNNIVRLLDFFRFREHLCLVFELLDTNLYELLKRNEYRGLSLPVVRYFLKQMLDALATLRDERIIHCDLKPENVLLRDQTKEAGRIKVIDFGSACLEHKTVYSYIQSRYYRSPEVVLGYPYTSAIDMWSLGCVAAELFLGLPLFPAASERDLLARIHEMLGKTVPSSVLSEAKHTRNYFKEVEVTNTAGHHIFRHELLSQDEFEARNKMQAPSGKRYFNHVQLADIIGAYPVKLGASDEEVLEERRRRECFVDFLLGILDVDPHSRWTPHQAALHPFISREPFKGPFQPPPAPDARTQTTPVGIQNQRYPKGHSSSWHADAFRVHRKVHEQAHATALAVLQHLNPQMNHQAASIDMCSSSVGQIHVPQSFPVQRSGVVHQLTMHQQEQAMSQLASQPTQPFPQQQFSSVITAQVQNGGPFGSLPFVHSLPNTIVSPTFHNTAAESVRQQFGSLSGLGVMVPGFSTDTSAQLQRPPRASEAAQIIGFNPPNVTGHFGKGERSSGKPNNFRKAASDTIPVSFLGSGGLGNNVEVEAKNQPAGDIGENLGELAVHEEFPTVHEEVEADEAVEECGPGVERAVSLLNWNGRDGAVASNGWDSSQILQSPQAVSVNTQLFKQDPGFVLCTQCRTDSEGERSAHPPQVGNQPVQVNVSQHSAPVPLGSCKVADNGTYAVSPPTNLFQPAVHVKGGTELLENSCFVPEQDHSHHNYVYPSQQILPKSVSADMKTNCWQPTDMEIQRQPVHWSSATMLEVPQAHQNAQDGHVLGQGNHCTGPGSEANGVLRCYHRRSGNLHPSMLAAVDCLQTPISKTAHGTWQTDGGSLAANQSAQQESDNAIRSSNGEMSNRSDCSWRSNNDTALSQQCIDVGQTSPYITIQYGGVLGNTELNCVQQTWNKFETAVAPQVSAGQSFHDGNSNWGCAEQLSPRIPAEEQDVFALCPDAGLSSSQGHGEWAEHHRSRHHVDNRYKRYGGDNWAANVKQQPANCIDRLQVVQPRQASHYEHAGGSSRSEHQFEPCEHNCRGEFVDQGNLCDSSQIIGGFKHSSKFYSSRQQRYCFEPGQQSGRECFYAEIRKNRTDFGRVQAGTAKP